MCDRGSLEGLFIPDREGGHQPPTFWKDLTGKFTIIPKKAHLFLATELPGISELVPTSFVNQLLNFESIHPPGGLFYLKFVPALLTNSWTLNLCLHPGVFLLAKLMPIDIFSLGFVKKSPGYPCIFDDNERIPEEIGFFGKSAAAEIHEEI